LGPSMETGGIPFWGIVDEEERMHMLLEKNTGRKSKRRPIIITR